MRFDSDRFEQIMEDIKILAEEAFDLLPEGSIQDRARSYWLAQIMTSVDSGHEYLGSSSGTMEDSKLEAEDCCDDYEDDDYEDEGYEEDYLG